MTRYLTPSKLILLLLTRLYAKGHIPWPARPAILTYIAARILPASPESCREIGEMLDVGGGLLVTLSEMEELLKGERTAYKTPDNALWVLFVKELWSFNSVDSIHQFFSSLKEIVLPPKKGALQSDNERWVDEEDEEDEEQDVVRQVKMEGTRETVRYSRTSPLGGFVRRASLEFTRLPFYDVVQLWYGFIRFRAPTGPPSLCGDINVDAGEDGQVSTNDIERLLELQVEKLEREGTRVSEDMKAIFRRLVGEQATVPSLGHFVKFLDAWKAGDYSSAFDNLHRYFDYTMQSRDKTYYQYALLHLAGLHADFGCFSEALSTMAELIATARENGDFQCLNYCLAWLNELVRSHPEEVRKAGYRNGPLGSGKQALAFLKTKAREGKSWSLLVSVMLSEARAILSSGESPSKVIELLFQSTHLVFTHQNHSNFGPLWFLHSATYSRLGLSHLAEDYCNILTDTCAPFVPADDLLRASCTQALYLSRTGAYSAALALLTPIPPPSRSIRLYQYATAVVRTIQLQRSLARMDLQAASSLLNQLQAADIPTDLRFELSVLEVDYLTRSGAIDAALERVAGLAERSAPAFPDDPCAADVYDRVRLLILKSRLFGLANQPERGFSTALRAANVSARARCFPLLWGAVACLADVLNRRSEFGAARALVDSVLPKALEGRIATGIGSVTDLYEVLGDSWVGQAGQVHESHQAGGGGAAAPPSKTTPDEQHAMETDSDPQHWLDVRDSYLANADKAFIQAEEGTVRGQDVSGRIRLLQKRTVVADIQGLAAKSGRLTASVRRCADLVKTLDGWDEWEAGAGGVVDQLAASEIAHVVRA